MKNYEVFWLKNSKEPENTDNIDALLETIREYCNDNNITNLKIELLAGDDVDHNKIYD